MTDISFNPCDPIFKLSVGARHDTVQVHQSVLCKSADFFKNSVKPEWSSQKAHPYTVDLSDDSLEVVTRYVQWLYSSKLGMGAIVPDKANASDKRQKDPGVQKLYETLVEAYIFGEKIMDATYTRALLGEMIQTNLQYKRTPGPTVLNNLYGRTAPNCLGRRLFAQLVAYNYFHDPEWNTSLERFPKDLLVEVIKVMASLRSKPGKPWEVGVSFIDKI